MADNTNYIGVAMGLDVTDLKSGLTAANKQIQLANAKFKSAASTMDDWTKSAAGIEAKLEQLGTVLDMQKKKLAGLNAEYEETVKQQGENSAAAQNLLIKIKNQEAVVNKTEREYKNYEETLKGVKDGSIDLEKVTLRAGKVIKNFAENNEEAATAANKLRKTVADQEKKLADLKEEYLNATLEQGKNSKSAKALSAEIKKLNGELDKNKEKLGDVKKETKEAGDGFTVAKGAIANFVGNGLTAIVRVAGNAIRSIAGLAAETREYRKTLATLDTAANDAGVNTDKMREKFTDLMGVFNDEGSVTEGLNNLMAAGFDEKNIDAITAHLEGAALKFKDTLKFEGVSDGLQETLATGKAIGPFAELLERSGVNLETFDEGLGKATTSAEKQNYVLQELSKLGLADVSKNFREQNADMIAAEKANVEYQNSMAELGEKVEPITTKIREGITKVVDKIIELTAGTDIDGFAEKISKGFDSFINDVLPKIMNGLQWIIDNKELVGGLAIAIGVVTGALAALNIVLGIQSAIMAANPTTWIIMGIIAAITLLVTAIVLVVKHWDKIKAAGAAAWEWIKNAWSAAGEWFSNIGTAISDAFSRAWQKLRQGAADAWQGVKNIFSKVGSFFSDTFSRAWQKVKDIFSTGGKIFDGIKDGIVSAFKNIVNAIIRGINKVVAVPFNAINKVLGKIRDVEVAGLSPFKNLISKISVPEIPELFRGGLLKRGQRGFLEGKGDEAVLPLERDTEGIKKIALAFLDSLGADIGRIKHGLSETAYRNRGTTAGTGAGGANKTVVNAGMTVNYNGKLSRKELKRLENDNYTAIRTRLATEGAI